MQLQYVPVIRSQDFDLIQWTGLHCIGNELRLRNSCADLQVTETTIYLAISQMFAYVDPSEELFKAFSASLQPVKA